MSPEWTVEKAAEVIEGAEITFHAHEAVRWLLEEARRLTKANEQQRTQLANNDARIAKLVAKLDVMELERHIATTCPECGGAQEKTD